MKSFAAVAILAGVASAYEGYAAPSPSTTPAYGYAAPKPSSSTSPKPYTTIYPCPDCPKSLAPKPCTVTKQHQTVSTCSVAAGRYATPVCSTYPYVSTTVKDYAGKPKTITKHNDYVTVYHTKSTITYAPTAKPSSGYGYFPKNGTAPAQKPTYEVYEKTVKAKYDELCKVALPGYMGSGLYDKCHNSTKEEDYQPVEVVECYGTKCTTSSMTYTYGKPTPSATTYSAPGTYTIPAYDVTITASTDYPEETAYHATAGDNYYGGVTTSCSAPTTFVYPHATVQTSAASAYTSIVYKTITVTKPGYVTIVQPTHTYCHGPKDIVFPTAKPVYPGEYHHSKETVTVTKSGQAYTCSYESSSVYPTTTSTSTSTSTSTPSYPTGPAQPNTSDYVSTPVAEYGYATAAAYVKRGGVIQRRSQKAKKAAGEAKRVILV